MGQHHFEGRGGRVGKEDRIQGSDGGGIQTHDDSARMCLGGHGIRFKCGKNSQSRWPKTALVQ